MAQNDQRRMAALNGKHPIQLRLYLPTPGSVTPAPDQASSNLRLMTGPPIDEAAN